MYNKAVKKIKTLASPAKTLASLALIVLIAGSLRFLGLNWDQGHALHPDERFLGMVTNDIKLPQNISQYFNPHTSPLNPRNIKFHFYVYGNFPVSLNKFITSGLNLEGLSNIILNGRVMSATADLLIVVLVFAAAHTAAEIFQFNKKIKYWASLTYALMVLPIQQSHFYTTDTLVNLFSFASFYFALLFYQKKNWLSLLLAGICWGLALGSKINALFIGPLIILFILAADRRLLKIKQIKFKQISSTAARTLLFVAVAYLSLRLSSPYLFASSNWLQPNLSSEFVENIKELKSLEGEDVAFPPAIQWINRAPVWFALKNMAVVGTGLPIFFLGLFGIYLILKKLTTRIKTGQFKMNQLVLLSVFVWCLTFFNYQSMQFVKSVRYFLILYPFLAIAAGLTLSFLFKRIKNWDSKKLIWAAQAGMLLFIFIWPLMFVSIYFQPHSRIQASHWIYQNIPNNSTIATEHWDDGLPIGLPEYQTRYKIQQLPVFGDDRPEKWQEIKAILRQADYYVLSSNRAWGSMSRLPEKYPQTSQFYLELLTGKTTLENIDLELIAEFDSFPSLKYLGIPLSFDDSWAEEAFSVYDHPQVLIYKIHH